VGKIARSCRTETIASQAILLTLRAPDPYA
jgi:hypothetical protein